MSPILTLRYSHGKRRQKAHLLTNSKIENWIQELDASDYRVRSYILEYLEERFSQELETSPTESIEIIAFQLVICCEIGFGGTRDQDKLSKLLQRKREGIDIGNMFDSWNRRQSDLLRTSTIDKLVDLGHL